MTCGKKWQIEHQTSILLKTGRDVEFELNFALLSTILFFPFIDLCMLRRPEETLAFFF